MVARLLKMQNSFMAGDQTPRKRGGRPYKINLCTAKAFTAEQRFKKRLALWESSRGAGERGLGRVFTLSVARSRATSPKGERLI